MIKHRFILILLMQGIFLSLFGKGLTINPNILASTDGEVRQVAALWENYFNASMSDNASAIDNYWNGEEITSGLNDMIKYAMTPNFSIYKNGNHYTFDIRKIDDVFYEINTWIEMGNGEKDVLSYYRVCAGKTEDGYRLYNAFHCNKEFLKRYKIGMIDYYYPYSYPMNRQSIRKIKNVVGKFNKIQQLYRIEIKAPITYILANSLDEGSAIIGFPYTKFRTHIRYAGFAIYPGILLACLPDHLHELIHGLFIPSYPKANILFQEGIATFYGGSSGRDYKMQIGMLKRYLQDNPNTDLSDFDSYFVLIDNIFNPFYTVGALIIDHALSIGGEEKVLELFQYSSAREGVEKVFNIPATEIHSYIQKLISQR